MDDDNESVLLRFDTGGFPDQVSEGITNNEATVSIDDDDVPVCRGQLRVGQLLSQRGEYG